MLTISGCATTTAPPKPTTSAKPSILHAQHMANIEQIQDFSLKGRIGVITQQKNHSARLAWQHAPKNDNIDIYSPLGGKVANIVKTAEQVTLTDSKQRVLSAKDARSLTKDTLGFSLPLAGLSYWALGKPSNKSIANAVIWDESGRIKILEQDGWIINFKNYAENENYVLPRKVTLKNQKITIKFIIDDWIKTTQ